jgi:hypothetical protein
MTKALACRTSGWVISLTRDERTRSWVNESDRFLVISSQQTQRGDVRVDLADGYSLVVFPAGYSGEAWRLFAPGRNADHLIFPDPADIALSRRKP